MGVVLHAPFLLSHRGKSPWALIPLQVEVGELSQDDFKAQNLRVSAMDDVVWARCFKKNDWTFQ